MNGNNNNIIDSSSFGLNLVNSVDPVGTISPVIPIGSPSCIVPAIDTVIGLQNGNQGVLVQNRIPPPLPTIPINAHSSPSPLVPTNITQPLKVSPVLSSPCPRSPPLVPKRSSSGRKLPQRPSSSLSSRTPSPLVNSPLINSPTISSSPSFDQSPSKSSISSPVNTSSKSSVSPLPPSTTPPPLPDSRKSSVSRSQDIKAKDMKINIMNGPSSPTIVEGVAISNNSSNTSVEVQKCIKPLVNGVISGETISDDGNGSLHKYVFHNDIKNVSRMVKEGKCDINSRDKHGKYKKSDL